MELAEVIAQGEGQTTEFKKSLSSWRKALESLCAMVNAESAKGDVVFGVEPGGRVCGVEPGNLDTVQRSLSQAIRDGFDPLLHHEIQTKEIEGKQLVLLHAERLRTVPYHEYDGRVWIRQGSQKHQLTLSEKDHLRRDRDRAYHPGPWKCDRCGSKVGELLSYKVNDKGMEKTYDCDCGGQFWPA